MTTLVSQNCIEIVTNLLNRQETARQALRDAEARYEAARQYMMAEQTAENALELHRARMQVRSYTEGLADIDRSLDHALLRDFYTYEGNDSGDIIGYNTDTEAVSILSAGCNSYLDCDHITHIEVYPHE